jgi:hypothetical protein
MIDGNENENYAKVDPCGMLLVGLDGFTIDDLARLYPGIQIGVHVKDGDRWVPVARDTVKKAISVLKQCDEYYSICWNDEKTAGLDGDYSIEELEAMIVLMRKGIHLNYADNEDT